MTWGGGIGGRKKFRRRKGTRKNYKWTDTNALGEKRGRSEISWGREGRERLSKDLFFLGVLRRY